MILKEILKFQNLNFLYNLINSNEFRLGIYYTFYQDFYLAPQ